MEYAEVELTCKDCGKVFTFKKACINRLAAEQTEYSALHRRRTLCPDCTKAKQEADELQRAAELGLPELVGRSEKQIKFAFSLRNRYVARNMGAIVKAKGYLSSINIDKVEEIAARNGFKNVDDCIAAAFQQRGLWKAYLCLTESNAQAILDNFTEKK